MKKTEESKDVLTTAAEAIGSALGKIAVKTGIANPLEKAGKALVPAKKSAKPSPAKRKVSTEATTAYAIGATLGKLAVKAGLATPARAKRKAPRKKADKAAPAKRKAVAKKGAVRKTPARAKKAT